MSAGFFTTPRFKIGGFVGLFAVIVKFGLFGYVYETL